MDPIEVVSTFNPLDALESISKIHNAKQLSKVEILKIQTEAKNFNLWIKEQRDENKEIRGNLMKELDYYRSFLQSVLDVMLKEPELTSIFGDAFQQLLETNRILTERMCETRIKIK